MSTEQVAFGCTRLHTNSVTGTDTLLRAVRKPVAGQCPKCFFFDDSKERYARSCHGPQWECRARYREDGMDVLFVEDGAVVVDTAATVKKLKQWLLKESEHE